MNNIALDKTGNSANALNLWVRIGIGLELLTPFIHGAVGSLWKTENNPYMREMSLKLQLPFALFSIFLLWHIGNRENWARRFFIVMSLLVLPLFPSVLFSHGAWLPSHHVWAWNLWKFFNAINVLFICGLVLYLFKPEVRAEFVQQPRPTYQKVLLITYVAVALLFGFILMWSSSQVTQWTKQGKAPAQFANIMRKQTERELDIFHRTSGVQIPPLGFARKPFYRQPYWTVTMVDFERPLNYVVVLSPSVEHVDLKSFFGELDRDYTQKAEAAGGFVSAVLNSRKGLWSKLIPINEAPISVLVNGASVEIQHVDFEPGTLQHDGYVVETIANGKRVTCMVYGQGDAKVGAIDFLQQIQTDNLPGHPLSKTN